jgi:hypothetical protein
MQHATSYPEWRAFAQQLDRLGHSRGGHSSSRIKDNLYDRKLLQQKLVHLQRVREHGNVKEMMFALRSDLIRNIANIAKRCVCAAARAALTAQPHATGRASFRKAQAAGTASRPPGSAQECS